MNRRGERCDGHNLLDSVDTENLNAEAMRLYISALEEYAEFEKAFDILSEKISKYSNDNFLLSMLVRLYDEKIIKAELFNEREKANELKAERENISELLKKSGADNIEE